MAFGFRRRLGLDQALENGHVWLFRGRVGVMAALSTTAGQLVSFRIRFALEFRNCNHACRYGGDDAVDDGRGGAPGCGGSTFADRAPGEDPGGGAASCRRGTIT